MKPDVAHRARLALLVWLMVTFFYFYLAYDYVVIAMNDREFGDYLQYVVQLAGAEKRPERDVQSLIYAKAEELALPIGREQIKVVGQGENLKVNIEYAVDISIPIIATETVLYRKQFSHEAAYLVR